MTTSKLVHAAFFVGLVASACAYASEDVAICGAKAAPKDFLGKHVSFRGKILSDGMHLTLAMPDSCPNEGYGVFRGDVRDDPASIIQTAVMQIGSPGTGHKEIAVDLDADIVELGNGHIGIRITKLNRMVLTYPTSNP
jgi:hypothetical protein